MHIVAPPFNTGGGQSSRIKYKIDNFGWNIFSPDSLFSDTALVRQVLSDLLFTSLMMEEALSGILAKLLLQGVTLYDEGVANMVSSVLSLLTDWIVLAVVVWLLK